MTKTTLSGILGLLGGATSFYLGHAGLPWYWVVLIAFGWAAIGIQKMTAERISAFAWAVAWLMAGSVYSLIYLALYFSGKLLW